MPPTEIYFEIQRIGNSVKVTAIDPQSGREATILGPANAGAEELKRTALNKLMYLMNK